MADPGISIVDWNPQPGAQKSRICVTEVSRHALVSDLDARMKDGRGFSVATLNLDHVVKLRSSRSFAQAYLEHSHVTADGNPIVWLSYLAGRKVELIQGSSLVETLVGMAEKNGVPIALFGSSDATLALATENLRQRYPGLTIAAQISPPMGFDPEGPQGGEGIEQLASSGAGLCLVLLGAVRQEKFAVRASRRLPHVGFASVGAGIDFVAGTQRRAPKIVQAIAMEWVWRMALNPRRLTRRYLACFAVLPLAVKQAIQDRVRPGAMR